MKIQEVINRLLAFHPPMDESHTCDVIKCGDPDQECTGIVTTVCATVEVIRKAAEQGANLIIVHEPLFYSDADHIDWLEGNEVFRRKTDLLAEHGIVVWRDHDHLHAGPPGIQRKHKDLVFDGIMRQLGWQDYLVQSTLKPQVYRIPKTNVEGLVRELTEKLNLTGARIVGNPDAEIETVFFCEHVNGAGWGGRNRDGELIQAIAENGWDAMIPFEIVDWTLSAWVRDAAQLGMNKVLIEMGHFNVEEAAMREMANWLPEVLGRDVPVTFLQSGDSFHYWTREQK